MTHSTTQTVLTRVLLVGAPLAFAALLILHPTGEGDVYGLIAEDTTPWLIVHFGGAVFFPLMALVIWRLLRGIPGRAATVARASLPVFAVFYGIFEALFGIASGIVVQEGNASSGRVAACRFPRPLDVASSVWIASYRGRRP